MWKIVYRLLSNYQDAQDCFQETFLSALETAQSEPVRNFCALLTKIATARAIDRLRRRYRCDANGRINIDALANSDPGPDGQLHSTELAEQLRQALAKLHTQEAEVFCLRFINDLSYRQIAKMTGLKRNAVGVMLHRTRMRLREILERQSEFPEKKVRYSDES